MNRVVSSLVCVMFFGVVTPADACLCEGGLPLCETVFSADAVFEGTVESIELLTFEREIGGRLIESQQKQVRFRDLKSWIGQAQSVVVTGNGLGDCGYTFNVGTRYIISANQSAGGVFVTSICHQTKPIAEGAELLAFLRHVVESGAGGRVSGEVTVIGGRFVRSLPKPLAGAAVELTGPVLRSSVTDARGKYEFLDLPKGDYQLTFRAPPNRPELVADSSEPVLFSIPTLYSCATRNYFMTIDGRIEGSVVDETWRPIPKATINLRAANPDSLDRPDPYVVANSDEMGFFTFKSLSPGSYILGVNLYCGPTRQNPYAVTFFSDSVSTHPSVVDLDTAEKRSLSPIVVRRLTLLQATGRVTLPDGQPLKGIHVLAIAEGEPGTLACFSNTHTRTDEAGNFVMELFRGVRYTLRVLDDGAPSFVETIAGDEPVTIVFTPRPRRH